MSHDVHQVRSFEHPGVGRKRAKSTPKGRQIDPTAAQEIEALLGRPAAAARSADRAPAPDPGQISSDFRRPSRGACRRDEAVLCRSVRDRDVLRAFRCGEGRRGRYSAADHPGLQFADLRHAGRRDIAAGIAEPAPVPAFAWCGHPASASATVPRSPKSATATFSRQPQRRFSRPRHAARPIPSFRTMSITTPM